MLYCPYCIGKNEPSDSRDEPADISPDFEDVGDSYQVDDSNKKTLLLKTHFRRCGRVFVAVEDANNEVIACFKLPDEDWLKKMLSYNKDN